jgi:hypothetical protein
MNINTCPAATLERAKGIGVGAAAAIIKARPHLSWDDVAAVKGIGPRAIERLRAIGLVVGAPSVEDQRRLDRAARAAERARIRAEEVAMRTASAKRSAQLDDLMAEYGAVEVIKPLMWKVDGIQWVAPQGKPTGRGGEIRALIGGYPWRIFRVGRNPWRIAGVAGSQFESAHAAAQWVAKEVRS